MLWYALVVFVCIAFAWLFSSYITSTFEHPASFTEKLNLFLIFFVFITTAFLGLTHFIVHVVLGG